ALIERYGWRRAFEIIGVLILTVLFPVAHWVTRSRPQDLGLSPDGTAAEQGRPVRFAQGKPVRFTQGRPVRTEDSGGSAEARPASQSPRANSKLEIGNSKLQTGGRNAEVGDALRSVNFWLILAGCTLTIG